MHHKGRWVCAWILLGLAGTVAAATTGDAVRSAGGSTLSGNAMDAIQETCVDLVVNSRNNAETPAQMDLRVNCGNMVRTTLSVLSGGQSGINEYGFASANQLYNGIRQFTGEETSSQGRYATETTNRQFSAVGSRLSAIRGSARGASGLSFNLQGLDIVAENADTSAGPVGPLLGGAAGNGADTGFAWFANIDYGFGDRDGSVNEDEYEYDAYEVSVGLDYAFDNGWALGGVFSYSDHEVDFDNASAAVSPVSGGSMETDGYTFSVFAQYHADAFYLSGIVGIGALDHEMERVVRFTSSGAGGAPNRIMNGDTDSDQQAAQLTLGHEIGESATTLDAYVGIDYLNIEIDDFTEVDPAAAGGLNLTFDDQDIDSVQSLIGATLRHSIPTDGGVLIPYLGLEWRHEFDNDARVVDARYAQALGDINGNGASINFAMPTDDPDEDFGEVTLGISWQLRNTMFLFAQWQSTVGLEDAQGHLITAGMRASF